MLFQHQGEQAFGALGWREAGWCEGSEKNLSPFGPLVMEIVENEFPKLIKADQSCFVHDLLSTTHPEADHL